MSYADNNVVVIGAGIAGLHVATTLAEANPSLRVTVMESRERAGGRVKTLFNRTKKTNKVVLEQGPWRVHNSHARMKELVKRHGLTLESMTSDSPDALRTQRMNESGGDDDKPKETTSGALDGVLRGGHDDASFSVWDRDALRQGSAAQADALAYREDYGPQHRKEAMGGNAYHVPGAKVGSYRVIKEGFAALIQCMHERANQLPNVELRYHHAVYDVVPRRTSRGLMQYVVRARRRTGDTFSNVELKASRVCIAVPPHAAERWTSVRDSLRLAWVGIRSIPLMHIYASVPRRVLHDVCPAMRGCEGFHLNHDGIGQQVISGERSRSDPEMMQVAYAAGSNAELLQRLRLMSADTLAELLAREVAGATRLHCADAARQCRDASSKRRLRSSQGIRRIQMSKMLPGKDPMRELKRCIGKSMRCFYYHNAVHKWIPSYKQNLQKSTFLATRCIDPIRLPGLVAAGEAVSAQQGWCEGALRTAFEASRELAHAYPLVKRLSELRKSPSHVMLYRGWLVDVTSWMHVHPGSSVAIKNHLFVEGQNEEDVEDVFAQIGHSSEALRTLASLRCGVRDAHGVWWDIDPSRVHRI